jgi:hypothetical protein
LNFGCGRSAMQIDATPFESCLERHSFMRTILRSWLILETARKSGIYAPESATRGSYSELEFTNFGGVTPEVSATP